MLRFNLHLRGGNSEALAMPQPIKKQQEISDRIWKQLLIRVAQPGSPWST